MRPPGGYTPDMMNYANDIDVYQIWADMVKYDRGFFDENQRPYCCVYAGRRDIHTYKYTHEEIMEKYKDNMCMFEVMKEILAGAMGNKAYMARFENEEDAIKFAKYVIKAQEK